jgi:hypothetical protein
MPVGVSVRVRCHHQRLGCQLTDKPMYATPGHLYEAVVSARAEESTCP